MKSIETAIGILFLLAAVVAIVMTYHRHMQAIYSDIAKEDAERIANKRFREMKRNMQVRVVQRLVIPDEMNKEV